MCSLPGFTFSRLACDVQIFCCMKKCVKTTDDSDLEIWPHQVQGGKYVKLLQKFTQTLREEDNATKHGNQELMLSDVFIASLLAFYNPTIKSLRTIEDFSQTRQAQKNLSIRKICKSTLSDFNALVDPERLQPVIEALRKSLAEKERQGKKATAHNSGLSELLKRTVAVDGTFLPALANVAWAIRQRGSHGEGVFRARFDALLHVESGLPDAIVVPEPKQGEADSAKNHIQWGKLYLYDRGYNSLELIAAHYENLDGNNSDGKNLKAEFVIRLKQNSPGKHVGAIGLTTVKQRKLTQQDREAGVISDRIVQLNSKSARKLGLQDLQLREVVLEYEENGETKQLRLLTNLLNPSAEIIGQLYRQRWQVELFFRWLKSYGNFRHLLSQTKQGMQLNLYIAIIGMLLMYLHSGFRPSKYLFSMMSQVASGGATLEEIAPIMRNREYQSKLARESQRRRLAKKKAEKIKLQNS